jgi:methylated-DNA-[protein]-cysteine S-methyltransferase
MTPQNPARPALAPAPNGEDVRHCLFDTAIGRCGIAWGRRGIVAVQLPESDDARTRARMLHRWPRARESAAPQDVVDAIASIAALLRGEVARRLGDTALSRAVGQALGRNPFAPVVPCHRVLAANGRIGGFSAEGGAALKARMLLAEGARPGDTPTLFDAA